MVVKLAWSCQPQERSPSPIRDRVLIGFRATVPQTYRLYLRVSPHHSS